MAERVLRAAIYLRRSRVRVEDPGLSEEVQEERCISYVRSHGWKFDRGTDLYKDWGKSAYRTDARRPAFEALLQGVREGRYDRVVVYRLDRLSRQWKQWADLLTLATDSVTDGMAVEFHSASEGITSAPENLLTVQMLAAVAQRESDNTAARVRATKQRMLAAGRWPGGMRPFGWMPVELDPEDPQKGLTLKLHPTEAAHLRAAVDDVLGGKPTLHIVEEWNRQGITGVLGRPWWQSSLSKLLRSRILLGQRNDKGGRPVLGEDGLPLQPYEALIDADTFDRLQVVLDMRGRRLRDETDPGRMRPRENTRGEGSALLAGLLFCAHCGCRLAGYARPESNNLCYRCSSRSGRGRSSCPGVSISNRRLDQAITELAIEALSPGLIDKVTRPPERPSAAKVRVAELRHALDTLEERQLLGEYEDVDGARRFERLRGKLVAELSELLERNPDDDRPDPGVLLDVLADADAPTEQGMKEHWEAMDRGQQRQVLRALFRRVEIAKGSQLRTGVPRGHFDVGRITVWLWAVDDGKRAMTYQEAKGWLAWNDVDNPLDPWDEEDEWLGLEQLGEELDGDSEQVAYARAIARDDEQERRREAATQVAAVSERRTTRKQAKPGPGRRAGAAAEPERPEPEGGGGSSGEGGRRKTKAAGRRASGAGSSGSSAGDRPRVTRTRREPG